MVVDVFAFQLQYVTRVEVRRFTTKQPVIEPAATIEAETDDFAVQHRAQRAHAVGVSANDRKAIIRRQSTADKWNKRLRIRDFSVVNV